MSTYMGIIRLLVVNRRVIYEGFVSSQRGNVLTVPEQVYIGLTPCGKGLN